MDVNYGGGEGGHGFKGEKFVCQLSKTFFLRKKEFFGLFFVPLLNGPKKKGPPIFLNLKPDFGAQKHFRLFNLEILGTKLGGLP